MSSGLLPDHIEPLVDRLRAGDHLPIALPDVAAVTEVLMRSLESYFKSIDLTLYKECQDLADYIEDARTEISSLSPDHDDSAGIPRAGQELDAIVEATESATDTIMQAAEDLMSFDSDNFDEYKNHMNTEVMKIFEACSFQDITGQRISKVVKTLNHVEDRVGKLIAILGINSNVAASADAKSILDPNSEEINENDLLSGPALAGEGINQGEVDSLLNDQMVTQPETKTEQEAPPEEAEDTQNESVNAQPETPEVSAEEANIEVNESETEQEEPPVEAVTTQNEGTDEQPETPDVPTAEVNVEASETEIEQEAPPVAVEPTQDEGVNVQPETPAVSAAGSNVEVNETETTEATNEESPDTAIDDPAEQLNDAKPLEKDQKNSHQTRTVNKAANEETSQDDIDSLFA